MTPIISILIPSLPKRMFTLSLLVTEIENQITAENANDLVDLVIHIDNKKRTTGEKRNGLLRQAIGEYIIFIDCDDWIYPNYVKRLLEAAKSGEDCFGMRGIITTDGENPIDWELSKDHPNRTVISNGKPLYLRTSNHISGVKKDLALRAMFPDQSNGEDKVYSERLNPFLKTEFKIEGKMYHYRFQSKNKEY